MNKALDADLDAYLDRELFVRPSPEQTATPVEKPAERLQGVLALAAEEEQWLRTRPTSAEPAENSKDLEGECLVPEHLKAQPEPEVSPPTPAQPPPPEYAWSPPPAPLPGLAVAPYPSQPWAPPVPVVPTVVSVAPRTHWLAAGALVGVGAAGLLAAGLLWMTRAPAPGVPESPRVEASPAAPVAPPSVAAPTVEAKVAPVEVKVAPVSEPVAPVASPEPKAPAVAAATLPSVPNLEGLGAATGGKSLTDTRVEAKAVAPRPAVPANKADAVVETPKRAELEDPYLSEMGEEEMPVVVVPPPARAPVPVAKAAPKRDTSKPEVYSEFDEDYARELGFTDDSVPKEPERKGVKSVWVPPEPGVDLPENLMPGDIQQVVVANQPAIASCVRRHKEATGASNGAFKVQWTVLPDGSTTRVQMLTVELRGTALSRCMEGLVRGWKFPKHHTQQPPIEFPFRF